jgi:peptidoglycan/xylan/chitin deacetylase (PgdA/CDA1 family)
MSSTLSKILLSTKLYKLSKTFAGNAHILAFHRIVNKQVPERLASPQSLEISSKSFEEILLFFMSKKYNFISIDDLHSGLANGSLSKKNIVVTFDDGYLDNFEVAYPILKKHNIPFTIYITTCFPDSLVVLWWYLLENHILQNDLVEIEVNGETTKYPTTNMIEKNNAYNQIADKIKYLDNQELVEVFSQFYSKPLSMTEELTMSWDNIIELGKDPLVTIGAHSVNHNVFNKLNDKELDFEYNESRRIIEEKTSKKVNHFAYPFGTVNEVGNREIDASKSTGYKTLVTTRYGNIFPEHKDFLFALPRIGIDPNDLQAQLEFVANGTIQFKKHKFNKVITY